MWPRGLKLTIFGLEIGRFESRLMWPRGLKSNSASCQESISLSRLMWPRGLKSFVSSFSDAGCIVEAYVASWIEIP